MKRILTENDLKQIILNTAKRFLAEKKNNIKFASGIKNIKDVKDLREDGLKMACFALAYFGSEKSPDGSFYLNVATLGTAKLNHFTVTECQSELFPAAKKLVSNQNINISDIDKKRKILYAWNIGVERINEELAAKNNIKPPKKEPYYERILANNFELLQKWLEENDKYPKYIGGDRKYADFNANLCDTARRLLPSEILRPLLDKIHGNDRNLVSHFGVDNHNNHDNLYLFSDNTNYYISLCPYLVQRIIVSGAIPAVFPDTFSDKKEVVKLVTSVLGGASDKVFKEFCKKYNINSGALNGMRKAYVDSDRFDKNLGNLVQKVYNDSLETDTTQYNPAKYGVSLASSYVSAKLYGEDNAVLNDFVEEFFLSLENPQSSAPYSIDKSSLKIDKNFEREIALNTTYKNRYDFLKNGLRIDSNVLSQYMNLVHDRETYLNSEEAKQIIDNYKEQFTSLNDKDLFDLIYKGRFLHNITKLLYTHTDKNDVKSTQYGGCFGVMLKAFKDYLLYIQGKKD